MEPYYVFRLGNQSAIFKLSAVRPYMITRALEVGLIVEYVYGI